MVVRLIEKTEPDQFWIPLKNSEEERLVWENLEQFVYLALIRFGYGSPRSLKLERKEDSGSWSAKFTATTPNLIITGEIIYLPKSNSLILSVSPRGGGA
jgi:hypothetical protein